MDAFIKNLIFSYKLLKYHFLAHVISYGFSFLIYIYLFSSKKKYFIITFLTFQTILLILISKMLCLLKITHFSSLDQIRCSLNIYLISSFPFLVLIVIQYILIFGIFNWKNEYKIILIFISLLYYIFDSEMFIYEFILIDNQIKKSISERITMQIDNINRNIENNIAKNDTQPSEKSNKNETFEKEDTVYIICEGTDKNKTDKKNKIQINNISFNEEVKNKNNDDISFGEVMKINKIKHIKNHNKNNYNNYIHKEFDTINTNTKLKLSLSEENKSKNLDEIEIPCPHSKEI